MSAHATSLMDASGGALSACAPKSYAADASDVRGRLTRLAARARQLLVDDADSRVVRNGQSVYETSRRAAAGTATRARAPGAAPASAELFLTALGFNVPEQQRLLQQLQASQHPLAAAPRGVGPAHSGGHGGMGPGHGAAHAAGAHAAVGPFAGGAAVAADGAHDGIDQFVATRRDAAARRAAAEAHRRVAEAAQWRSEAAMRAAWERHAVCAADALESAALPRGGPPFANGAATAAAAAGAVAMNPQQQQQQQQQARGAGVAALLRGRGAGSARLLRRVHSFARIVDAQAPTEWPAHFAAAAAELSDPLPDPSADMPSDPSSAAALARLWAAVERLLLPAVRAGGGATALTFAAASRASLERHALHRVLSRALRVDAARLHELSAMDAARFAALLERQMDGPWARVYAALRCGRADAAALMAEAAGQRLVAAALRRHCDSSSAAAGSVLGSPTAAPELRALYDEDATRGDAHREMVLLLLLGGEIGDGEAAAAAALSRLLARVAQSLEEMLWARLFLVREAGPSSPAAGAVPGVRSLAAMQRLLLDDMPDLVALVRGDGVRLAALLLHALLPASAARVLIGADATYVDGVHIALCYHACGGEAWASVATADVPLDLPRHLTAYCAHVLLSHASPAAFATFRYFHRAGLSSTAFVELCRSDAICQRLFGAPSAALLSGVAAPSAALLDAMAAVADDAVHCGRAESAARLLEWLAAAAEKARDGPRAAAAIRRAAQVLCPALAQSLQCGPSSRGAALAQCAADLERRAAGGALPHAEAAALRALCGMADVAAAAARGDTDVALRCFAALPFAPRGADDAERAAAALDTAQECVRAAAAPVALAAARLMWRRAAEHRAAGEDVEAAALRERARALAASVRRWRGHAGRSLAEELDALERSYRP